MNSLEWLVLGLASVSSAAAVFGGVGAWTASRTASPAAVLKRAADDGLALYVEESTKSLQTVDSSDGANLHRELLSLSDKVFTGVGMRDVLRDASVLGLFVAVNRQLRLFADSTRPTGD